jgi:class 3 adenylate cyclase/tetratricopeptide (TPR) repeat protein
MAEPVAGAYHRAVTQGSGRAPARSTAIVLFTDLVGSTELRSQLGEAAAEDLRRQHDALVTGGVVGSGGTVVKNLGDGFMATFGGASDAVAAAIAIQQAIARHNRVSGTPIQVRVGVSAGDVVYEDADCFGTPVVEAARLCAAAQGGQILASEIVRWMAHADDEAFTPVGSLELKGLSRPLPTVQVDWAPAVQSPVPLPTFLTDIGRIFVGRDGELDRLGQLWKEAAAGERRVAFLAGEPGVGKTRLAAELATRVHDEGATVLAGRCDEDLGVPYQPFVEALRHFADHAPDVERRLGRYGGELARLVPELGDRVPGLSAPIRSDPEMERYRLFDAVAAWLTATSSEEPLLLVLDDLQWAAKPTLLLLRHLVRSGGGRILVLGTHRDTELSHDHPLVEVVADLRREGGVERLSIAGLDGGGVAAMVEQASGQVLDEDGLALARAVHEETEGNPFFVREVLRHLAETGAIERQDGRWKPRLPAGQLGIPEGVRDVVGRRLARLSGDTNQALRVAAVVGPEFEFNVVQAAGDLSEERLLAAIEEAANARVVIEVSATRFRFAHALVRATLYDSLTTTRQVVLHRKTAEAIEAIHARALDDFVPTLAHHWAKASAPVRDVTRAVMYAQRAGDRALAQLAHDEAARYYMSGLELLDAGEAEPRDPRRLELLIGRGEAERRASDPGYRETLLDAARLAAQLGDASAQARAALANTLGHIWTAFSVDQDRIEVLESAIGAVGDEDLPVRARLLATLGLELAWQPDPTRRVALSDEALRIARDLDDPTALAHVLLARDYTITDPANVEERFDATSELLAIAERLGDPVLASRALSLRFKAAVERADIDEAERSLACNGALVADLGQPGLAYFALHHRAALSALRCEPDADEKLSAADNLGQMIATPEFLSAPKIFSWSRRGCLMIEQGRADELEGFFREMLERSRAPFVRAMYGMIRLDAGDREPAADALDDGVANGFAHPRHSLAWLMFQVISAWCAARLGRKDCVPPLRAAMEPYADQIQIGAFGGWIGGSVSLYLAMLAATVGDYTQAEAEFAVAAATHDRIRAPIWFARTQLEWSRMLLARAGSDDIERARDLLVKALEAARKFGLARLEQEATELLASP